MSFCSGLRPATLVTFIDGASPTCPSPAQCKAMGQFLATLHTCTPPERCPPPECDAHWRLTTAEHLLPLLPKTQADLLHQAMAFNTIDETGPVGLLHGDLFKDNTLFDGAVLKGVIDFYFAHHGPCLYDMAIALNDWATTSVGKIHERRYHAFLSGYESIRPLSTTEFALLTRYQCQAALRFWLSRLEAKYLPDAGQLPIRDPDMMASRLTHLLKSLN